MHTVVRHILRSVSGFHMGNAYILLFQLHLMACLKQTQHAPLRPSRFPCLYLLFAEPNVGSDPHPKQRQLRLLGPCIFFPKQRVLESKHLGAALAQPGAKATPPSLRAMPGQQSHLTARWSAPTCSLLTIGSCPGNVSYVGAGPAVSTPEPGAPVAAAGNSSVGADDLSVWTPPCPLCPRWPAWQVLQG